MQPATSCTNLCTLSDTQVLGLSILRTFFCVSPNRESLCVLLCVLLCGLMWALSPQLRTVPSCREALKDHGAGIPGDFSRVSSCDAMKKPSAMISEIGDRFFEPPQKGNLKTMEFLTAADCDGFWCSFHCVPSLSSTYTIVTLGVFPRLG